MSVSGTLDGGSVEETSEGVFDGGTPASTDHLEVKD